MCDIQTVRLAVTIAVVMIAAAIDVHQRRIPNWLTLPALAFQLLASLMFQGPSAFGATFLSACVAAGIFLLFFLAGGMGGGDVKLIAASAAGVGLSQLAPLLVFTSLCGGAMAIFIAISHRKLRETLGNMGAIMAHHRSAGLTPHAEIHVHNKTTLRLPYGVAIAAGTLLTLYAKSLQEVIR